MNACMLLEKRNANGEMQKKIREKVDPEIGMMYKYIYKPISLLHI